MRREIFGYHLPFLQCLNSIKRPVLNGSCHCHGCLQTRDSTQNGHGIEACKSTCAHPSWKSHKIGFTLTSRTGPFPLRAEAQSSESRAWSRYVNTPMISCIDCTSKPSHIDQNVRQCRVSRENSHCYSQCARQAQCVDLGWIFPPCKTHA